MVGGYPSVEDELARRPFAGEDGALLTRMLKAIDIDISSVYLTLAVKCRPVAGQPPDISEIKSCNQWLEHEMDMVGPLFVLLLGGLAVDAFRGCQTDFDSFSNKVHVIGNLKVMAIHSPDFVLSLAGPKQTEVKREV